MYLNDLVMFLLPAGLGDDHLRAEPVEVLPEVSVQESDGDSTNFYHVRQLHTAGLQHQQ